MKRLGFTNKSLITGLLVVAACLASTVRAASVSLLPTTPISDLLVGDIVSFDITIDFSTVGTLGGGFDISYDASELLFIGLSRTILGDPAFSRPPDPFDGLLESWGVGDFNGLAAGGPELVGSVSFQVLPGMDLSTLVALGPTQGIAGPWVSATDFVTWIEPEYNAIELTRAPAVIPIPAAAWLFGSAMLALVGLRRRRSAASS